MERDFFHEQYIDKTDITLGLYLSAPIESYRFSLSKCFAISMTVCHTGDWGTWASYVEIFHQLTGTWLVYEMADLKLPEQSSYREHNVDRLEW